ncbi:MAG: transcription antitermination factor NusB [Candidatus Margulisbacteria bacterium]|jgi:N utilization substance protein B|nr:transcription antitermination factor NusB [Candidatus Margulisiibacteriota bacterium]
MGKRTTARRLAMQALYQAEMSGHDIAAALDNLLTEEPYIDETKKFARELAEAAWQNRTASDGSIAQLSTDWPLDRLGKVDLAILRLAVYELTATDTPHSVIINEAVELAKKYSGEEAGKFINGILGGYLRK